MTNIRAKTRVGFTLVELLVVISIIAILAALSTSAYFRVRAGQESSATEATLTKLNTGLDRRWRAVIDQAAEDSRTRSKEIQTLTTYAGNNTDRARTIWTYMLLKNEFPTTFLEATTPVSVGGVTLQPRSVFTQQLTTTGGTEAEQSAVCFYLALTATGNRGETFMSDGTNNQTREIKIGGKDYSVFTDAWGKPIAFSRMSYSPEIKGLNNSTNGLYDPLDQTVMGKRNTPDPNTPYGTLDGMTWANLPNFWSVIRTNHIGATNIPPSIKASYENLNWVPTLISAGPNEEFGDLLGGDDNGADNVLSFRLRKEGARGD